MTLRRKVAIGLATAGVCGAGYGVWWGQNEVRRQLPSYLSGKLSAALKRPVVLKSVSFWPPPAFTIHDVEILPGPTESKAPLTAESLRVHISWLSLLFKQQLVVQGLEVVRPVISTSVDLRDTGKRKVNPGQEVMRLASLGVRDFSVRDAAADVLVVLPDGSAEPLSLRDGDGKVRLSADRFRYDLKAANWSGGGLEASNVELAGIGDENNLTVRKSGLRFEGGSVGAKGQFSPENGRVVLHVDAKELPLENLARQVGVPKEWVLGGKLTGSMDVSAATGALQRMQGTVSIAPGSITRSKTEFPWTNASAQIDWRPERVTLTHIDVVGKSLRLRGQADVAGPANLPFANRQFSTSATVEARDTEAVTRLAQLLAFSTPVKGTWDVAAADLTFKAAGKVGDIQKAKADGALTVRDLNLRPWPGRPPITINSVQTNVIRREGELALRNVVASGDGLNVTGDGTIYQTGTGKAGTFNSRVEVVATNLALFEKQFPSLAGHVRPASNAARIGSASFVAGGPLDDPDHIGVRGEFKVANVIASVPIGSENWDTPLNSFTGQIRGIGRTVRLEEMVAKSDYFSATGDLRTDDLARNPRYSVSMSVLSPGWRQIPPLASRVPAFVSGGNLRADVRSSGPTDKPGPLSGTLTLAGATLRFEGKSAPIAVPLRIAEAQFKMTDQRLDLPAYRLVTSEFRLNGAGHAVPTGPKKDAWIVAAKGRANGDDAGRLVKWVSGREVIRGGIATADYTVKADTSKPNAADVSGKLHLTNAQPLVSTKGLPFKLEELAIRSLDTDFSTHNGEIRFSDAVWNAPAFQLKGDGRTDGTTIAGHFALNTDEWRRFAGDLAKTLPVEGGALTVSGDVSGPLARIADLPVKGEVVLRGAKLSTAKGVGVPVRGGTLDVRTSVVGTVSRLVQSDLDGSFSLTGAELPSSRKGGKTVPMTVARGEFQRRGNTIDLTNLRAEAANAALSGTGKLFNVGTATATHRFDLTASGPSLSALLPAIWYPPGTAEGGRFKAIAVVSGSRTQPVGTLDARAEVTDAKWTPPGQTTSMEIERMTTHLTRRGEAATIDDTVLRVDGGEVRLTGNIAGLGTTAGPRHNLQARWHLNDASGWVARFFPIPGKFTGGVFTGNATVTGDRGDAARTANGTFSLAKSGFMPPKQVLGGPIRPIQIESAGGKFSRANRVTHLTELAMRSSIGTATGEATQTDGVGAQVTARADIARLDDLIDLWPAFKGRLVGGRGAIQVNVQGPLQKTTAMTGTIRIAGHGGKFTVENVDPIYAEHPFEDLVAQLRLDGTGRVAFERVRMKGPKANFEGSGEVSRTGVVSAKGDSWLTETYTKQIFKPKFLYPVAKLVGLKKIKSKFEIDGTLRESRLDMGITDSLLWKMAIKKRVPENLRKIATGDAPLWSADAFEPPPVPARTRTVANVRR